MISKGIKSGIKDHPSPLGHTASQAQHGRAACTPETHHHHPPMQAASLHVAFLQKPLLNHLRLPQQRGSRRWSSQVSLPESETRSTYIFTARSAGPLHWILVSYILFFFFFFHEISGSQIEPVDHQRPPGLHGGPQRALSIPIPPFPLQHCPPHTPALLPQPSSPTAKSSHAVLILGPPNYLL